MLYLWFVYGVKKGQIGGHSVGSFILHESEQNQPDPVQVILGFFRQFQVGPFLVKNSL